MKASAIGLACCVAALCLFVAPAFLVPRGASTMIHHHISTAAPMRPAQFSTEHSPYLAQIGIASALVAVAAVAGALMRPASMRLKHKSAVQVHARRELAVAYEDSGIELLDNGKFCQGLVGGDGAWGEYNFDPAGFSKFTELVPYLREAELKHGRIAMLAWIGLAVPDFVRIPGERYSFEAIPVTIDAHDKLNGSIGVNFQVLFWVAILEFCCAKKVFEWNSLECAGDYNLGAQFLPTDEEGQKKIRMAELKNGRLAMIAFGGAVTEATITRHPFPWLF